MRAAPSKASAEKTPDGYWQSLHYFNLYRLVIAGVFAAIALYGEHLNIRPVKVELFFITSLVYVILAAVSELAISSRWPRFDIQLSGYVLLDIVCITLLTFASGGLSTGLPLLIVVTLATASLVSNGRLATFNAAMATIFLLLEQSFEVLHFDMPASHFFQAGLFSLGFFATAILANTLSRRLMASEIVSRQRGVDLANMAKVNQLVIQDMQDGVLVVDGRGRIRQANQQASRLLAADIRTDSKSILSETSSTLAERFKLWAEDPEYEFDPMRVLANGKQLRTRFVPVAADRRKGAVIFLEDLSDVNAQAQQLKLAALGRLTANIAHEIRNPLSAISHATQLMKEEAGLDATQKRLMQIVDDNTRRLDRMVQDVLQLNRRDRAQGEEIFLQAFLSNFAEEFAQFEKIPREGLLIESEAPEAKILFDRSHLHQTLWNLCRNAWRHSKQNAGSIRMYVSRAHYDDVVQLDVIDDGGGVRPEAQEQLFEPFFTTENQGTGLGLYIAREVCEANGASLDYVEVAPGGQFRICCKEAHA